MKTERLIDLLARGAGPAPRALAARRLAPAAVLGLLAAGLLAVQWFGGVAAAEFGTWVPWIKLAYAAAMAAAAAGLATRLSRPAAPAAAAGRLAACIVAAMGLFGVWSLLAQPAGTRLQVLLGHSWSTCPWSIVLVSLPALAASLWALRGLAPTRPAHAGFAAGLLAGALGAGAYALSCTEWSPAFIAAWYTLGMLLTGGLGALLGPKVLRW
jgi:hypothetical protein